MPLIFFGTWSVSPATAAIGDTITLTNTGAGCFDTMIVIIGGIPADSIAVDTGHGNGQQRITCDIPAGVATGLIDIYVENPDGENATITGALSILSNAVGSYSVSLGLGICI